MQGNQLFNEGLALMELGMGFVFVFLTILVITTTLMSKCIGRFFPESSSSSLTSSPATTPDNIAQPGDEVIAVLSAAVHRYRRNHPR